MCIRLCCMEFIKPHSASASAQPVSACMGLTEIAADGTSSPALMGEGWVGWGWIRASCGSESWVGVGLDLTPVLHETFPYVLDNYTKTSFQSTGALTRFPLAFLQPGLLTYTVYDILFCSTCLHLSDSCLGRYQVKGVLVIIFNKHTLICDNTKTTESWRE